MTPEPWIAVADAVGLVCIGIGALLCLVSAIGLLTLRDLFARMHAATKPQALGMLVMLLGVFLRMRSWEVLDMVVLVSLFQMMTIPVSAHLVSRAQYRIGRRPPERLPTPRSPSGDDG